MCFFLGSRKISRNQNVEQTLMLLSAVLQVLNEEEPLPLRLSRLQLRFASRHERLSAKLMSFLCGNGWWACANE